MREFLRKKSERLEITSSTESVMSTQAELEFYGEDSLTYLTMVASFDRSSRCAASTAATMAPSSAERSQYSSVTKNFLARLKKAAGPLDALTAITCLGWSSICWSALAAACCGAGFFASSATDGFPGSDIATC